MLETHTEQGVMHVNDITDPVRDLAGWIESARRRGERDAHAATLATVDSTLARPSARTVYVRVEEDTLVFFVNARTGKGQQLQWHPHAALCFFWREIQQQVNVEGVVQVIEDRMADRLWSQRSRESILVARSSEQHAVFGDTDAFRARLAKERDSYSFERAPRPEHWIGYRLLPTRVEFWSTGWHRARPRRLFERAPDGGWQQAIQEP